MKTQIFEVAALGKPIWAGVSGYAAQFFREEVTNAAVFDPCDVDQAVTAFGQLDMRDAPRPDFVRRYSRAVIMGGLASEILQVTRGAVSG